MWTSNSTVSDLILVNGTIQGYNDVSGNITLNGTGTLKSTNNGTLRIKAPITGTGDLVFDAGVRVELHKNNTYVGNTTIKATEVRLSSNNSFGTGTVTLSGGTLKNNNNSPTVTNNIIIDENGGTVTAGWNATIHLKGTISGSGNLALSPEAGATIQLYGDNKDYTGNITIKTGTVRLSSSTPFGSGTVTLSGATLKNNNNSPVITNNIILDKNGGSVISGWGKTTTLSGKITGIGSLTIKDDDGSVCLAGADSDFSGGLKIGDNTGGATSNKIGRVTVGANNALGTGLVTFGDSNSWLDLAGYNASIRGLDSGSFTGISVKNSASTASTLTLGAGTTAVDSYTYAGEFANNINLVKIGDGTQIFGVDLAPTTISISGGVLQTTGNLAMSGTWNENATATSEFGEIAAKSVIFDPNTKLELYFSDDFEFVAGQSFALLTGTNDFIVTGYDDPSVFKWDSLLSDDASWAWDLSYMTLQNGGGAVILSVNPNLVPEPATWAMLLVGVSVLVLGRRKQ